jgi:hypothetical protein
MQMISVRSSAISAVGYDPQTLRMKITFTQGHSYDFCRVPQRIYEDLMNAYSKGQYYNGNIKDRYTC